MIGTCVTPCECHPPPLSGKSERLPVSLHFPSQSTAILSVARKLEIDLPEAIRLGDLAPEDLSGMLRECSHCWHSRKCSQWQRNPAAREMAAFCPSAEAINDLLLPQRPAGRPHLRAVR